MLQVEGSRLSAVGVARLPLRTQPSLRRGHLHAGQVQSIHGLEMKNPSVSLEPLHALDDKDKKSFY